MRSCKGGSVAAKLVTAIAFVGLTAGCTLRAVGDDEKLAYKLAPGPYQVITIEESHLYDAQRDKDLVIKMYVPDATEKFPVIIFSHGAVPGHHLLPRRGRLEGWLPGAGRALGEPWLRLHPPDPRGLVAGARAALARGARARDGPPGAHRPRGLEQPSR